VIAQMFNRSGWIPEVDPDILGRIFEAALLRAGFKILNFCEHHFEPQGWTALWLLGESHFAIHTFPEEGRSYIELSSCVEEPFRKFCERGDFGKE
jgi:S-adenosylmethionine decarboxylase